MKSHSHSAAEPHPSLARGLRTPTGLRPAQFGASSQEEAFAVPVEWNVSSAFSVCISQFARNGETDRSSRVALPAIRLSRRPNQAAVAGFFGAAIVFLNGISGGTIEARAQMISARSIDTLGLYHLTNIWNAHLTFSADQWEAMEPKGGFGGFGGPPGGPGVGFGGQRGPGGANRGGPGGPGGGPGGFGPAMFIAPALMDQADANKDGKLSRAEFEALGEKWFTAWDTNKAGQLEAAKIRSGLNTALAFGGPVRPHGTGGPGPGGGMMLQGPEGKRNGVAAMVGIEFNYVHADLEFEGRTVRDVGIRYKGNGTFMESRGALKRSFKVDLNEYTKGRHLGGSTVLNLHSCVTDASFMNEVLAYQLYREAGVPAPRTAFARVYLTVPGKYDHKFVGLYSLVQNVDKHFLEENFGTKRGVVFKPVAPSLFTYLGDDWKSYGQTYDPKTSLFEEQQRRMIELCRLMTSGSDSELAAHVGEYIDVAQFARFMAVMVFLSDMDGILGPGQNLYLYLHPKTQLITFLPWDQDHSWGQFAMRGTAEQRENLSLRKPWEGDNNRFLARMYNLAEFQKEYRARLEEFCRTIFRPERFSRQVDQIASALRSAVREESEEKLARFEKVVAGEAVGPGGFGGPGPGFAPPGANAARGGPGSGEALQAANSLVPANMRGPQGDAPGQDRMPFRGPFGFMQELKPIKTFTPVRFKSIQDQLAGKSEGLSPGGMGGMGGPGGRGGPGGGPGGRGPSGPGDFGPGMFLSGVFLEAMDADKDGAVTRAEMLAGFRGWYGKWTSAEAGKAKSAAFMTDEQLRAGINQDLSPFKNGGPPGFGGPGGGPPGSGPPDFGSMGPDHEE